MSELSQMNVRNVHMPVREDRHSGERFVAVRPATVEAPSAVVTTPSTPEPTPRWADSSVEATPVDRAALLIGTSTYDHDAYEELPSALAGIRKMQHVLERPDVGMMDTCAVIGDATKAQMMRGIEAFLEQRGADDTLLVYVSGYAAVSERDGRLYLLTKDSDPSDLAHTAVPAEFLCGQLQECRATSKVVLLDHYGTATSDIDSAPALPEPAGVYVITGSEYLRPAPSSTSPFTTAIVEGLNTGRVKSGLGPWVTADDLAGYLGAATSTLAANGSHVIARSTVRALSLLSGPGATSGEGSLSSTVPASTRHGSAGQEDAPSWSKLAAYYRACLADAPSPVATSPRGDTDGYAAIGSGAEALLAGTTSTVLAPGGVDTFDWKEREFWYGYPLVTLAGGGRRHSASPVAPVTVAPLLVQRVEVTVDERGAAALRPTGPVMPHAGVLRACLDDQEAASVLTSWRPTWRSGDHEHMLVVVRQLMKRLGLSELQALDPHALDGDGVASATRTGAHNAAGVLYTDSTRAASVNVSVELATLVEDPDRISGTALEQVGGMATPARQADAPPQVVVTPDELTETQETVLESAMTRPLTVATAPPGTGKDALIVDAVSTAVASGQKVLVVAPDEQSITGVVDRCAELAPGMLIRTGDAHARAEEKQVLRHLLRTSRDRADDRTRGRSRTALAGELTTVRNELTTWRERLADHVGLETALRKSGAARAAAAERLGFDVAVLASAWAGDNTALADWIDGASALSSARVGHAWRRTRTVATYMRAVTAAGGDSDVDVAAARRALAEPEAFESLVLFARAELRVREDRRQVENVSDDQLDDAGRELVAKCRRVSAELIDVTVQEKVDQAVQRIEDRRRALEPGGRDRPTSQRELMRHLGGWAVTVDEARQLAMEPGAFDLVVIDDAHETSVAAMLPLLFRAARALVIGDPARRGHEITVTDHRHRRAREQADVSARWLAEHRLNQQTDSAFEATAARVDDVALLDEHAGSHPRIARMFDEAHYGDRLTVLTDVASLRRAHDPETGQSTLLLWEDVHGTPERGPNGGSWRNQAEVDRVVWTVNELCDQLPPDATIAVMTPFRAQAEELRSLFRFGPVVVGSPGEVRPDACDAIIVSLVVNADTPDQTVRWVESRTALWNASLAGARAHVVGVGDHSFWANRPGLPGTLAKGCSVRSFHVHPVPPERPEVPETADGLADLMVERLSDAGHSRVERDALLDGYRCDVLVETADGAVAVLLDRGVAPGGDAARHLRLMLRRRRVLNGVRAENGTARVSRVLRVPAWRVRSATPIPGLTD